MADLTDDVGCWGLSGQAAANLLEGSEKYLDYGFSLHHSGHLTLCGVRVAFMIVR